MENRDSESERQMRGWVDTKSDFYYNKHVF